MTQKESTTTLTLQLIAGLPPEEVQERLRDANRATDLGHRMLAFYLHEMQDRRLFQLSGHSSAVHYATTRLGMRRRRARQLVAAGAMLSELTEIDQAFCTGALSWSKVRLLSEVAVAGTQGAWIERAKETCCRELEHEVRTTERGRPPRRDGRLGLPVVRFQVRATLDSLGLAQWEKARQRLREETGREVTDAELLRHLAAGWTDPGDPRRHTCATGARDSAGGSAGVECSDAALCPALGQHRDMTVSRRWICVRTRSPSLVSTRRLMK